MKSLKESILDDMENSLENGNIAMIMKFLKENYTGIDKVVISEKPNKQGLYEVKSKDGITLNPNAEAITDGTFTWTKVRGYFIITDGLNLKCKDLTGCPKEVKGAFKLYNLPQLESLKGGPDIVGGYLSLFKCPKLKSLEHCPKKIGGTKNLGCVLGGLTIVECHSLKNLEGCPSVINGNSDLVFTNNNSLESLKGCPQKAGRFECTFNPKLNDTDDMPKEITGKIIFGKNGSYNWFYSTTKLENKGIKLTGQNQHSYAVIGNELAIL